MHRLSAKVLLNGFVGIVSETRYYSDCDSKHSRGAVLQLMLQNNLFQIIRWALVANVQQHFSNPKLDREHDFANHSIICNVLFLFRKMHTNPDFHAAVLKTTRRRAGRLANIATHHLHQSSRNAASSPYERGCAGDALIYCYGSTASCKCGQRKQHSATNLHYIAFYSIILPSPHWF